MKELKKEEMMKVEGGGIIGTMLEIHKEDMKKIMKSKEYKDKAKKRIEDSKKDGSGSRPSHDGFGK